MIVNGRTVNASCFSTPALFAPRLAALGVPVMTINHNVELDFYNLTMTSLLLWALVLRVVRRNEMAALLHSTVNPCMTTHDADRFRSAYNLEGNTAHSPLGTFEMFQEVPAPAVAMRKNAEEGFCLAITGSLCDYQTIDGVRWFIGYIYPLLKKAMPDAQVILAGSLPLPEISDLAKKPGVRLIPNPESIDAIVQQAQVYLAPTRLGSGLKLRLKGGLRLGLPVVSHAVSARGCEGFFPDPFFQTFTTPEDCIAALLRVRDRLPLDMAIRQQIESIYKEQFMFPAGLVRLREILERHVPASSLP